MGVRGPGERTELEEVGCHWKGGPAKKMFLRVLNLHTKTLFYGQNLKFSAS